MWSSFGEYTVDGYMWSSFGEYRQLHVEQFWRKWTVTCGAVLENIL